MNGVPVYPLPFVEKLPLMLLGEFKKRLKKKKGMIRGNVYFDGDTQKFPSRVEYWLGSRDCLDIAIQ